MTDDQFSALLETGIRLAQDGNIPLARIYISRAVKSKPDSARAWFWLSQVVEEDDKKQFCYLKSVKLNPSIVETEPRISNKLEVSINNEHKKRDQSNFPGIAQPDVLAKSVIVVADKANYQIPVQEIETADPILEKNYKQSRSPRPFLVGLFIGIIIFSTPIIFFVQSGLIDSYMLNPRIDEKTPVQQSTLVNQSIAVNSLPATYTPTIKPTLTVSPTPNQQSRIQMVEYQMQEATSKITSGDYPNAILILNLIIKQVPEFAEAYFQRGYAYYKMVPSLRSQTEYKNYLAQAIDDYDMAIKIGPVNGDYFVYRGYALWDYANEFDLRQEREPLLFAALENVKAGSLFGTTIQTVPLFTAMLYNQNGECEQGLVALQEILKKYPNNSIHDYHIEQTMAESYLCLKQYTKALEQINKALACNCDSWTNKMLKAEILYSIGDKKQALDILDEDIEKFPGFAGKRYYYRALIYYDFGNYDLAKENLMIGSGNTWGHGGIYLYLLAKFAQLDGDIETAKALMQNADETILRTDSPVIRNRIKKELIGFGLTPLEENPQPFFIISPMPDNLFELNTPSPLVNAFTLPKTMTPTPEANLPTGYLDYVKVNYSTGTGSKTIYPNSSIQFHFALQEPLTFEKTTRLVFQLFPVSNNKPPLQLYLWTSSGGWRMMEPIFGSNEIDFPSYYLNRQGDLYISLRNTSSSEPVSFENAGFSVTVQKVGGALYTFGLDKSVQYGWRAK